MWIPFCGVLNYSHPDEIPRQHRHQLGMNSIPHRPIGLTPLPQMRAHLGVLGAALISLMVILTYFLWAGHREAEHVAVITTQNLVLALESRLQGTLARTDAVLLELAHDATPGLLQKSAVAGRQQEMSARMVRQLLNFPEVSGTYYFDADGDMLYSSDPHARSSNVTDRPFFRYLRDHPDNGLQFSDALVARTTGRMSVVIARGIRDKDNRFLGVTTALFDLETFAQLLETMNIGAHSTVVLRRTDTFNLVTRYPLLPNQGITALAADNTLRLRIAGGERNSTLFYTSQQDGVVRLSSFRALEQYPFFLYMGIPKDEYLSGWYQQALGAGLVATALLLLFAFAAVRMVRVDRVVTTAQRLTIESEARFRHFFQHNSSVMLLIDPISGQIIDANQAAADYYGYASVQLLGMPINKINTLPEEAIAKEHALAASEERNYFNFHHQLASGGIREVEVHSTPIETGGRTLLFSIIHDITSRKQAESELRRSNLELEQFSYSISHDMRQPLRMISSYLQLLQKSLGDSLDTEQREYFHFAIDGAQRLDAMLRGLLDYSRIGRKNDPMSWIESRAVLDEALLFLRPLLAEAHAEVSIHGEWPRIFASLDEILRLLQNLIGNALKFRVEGRPPVVTISSEIIDGQWQIRITDNGVGIQTDQIGRLFQVFQRLQSRTAFEGTGIGLALCRKIVEHHNGQISVESAGAGCGSTFRFAIPVGSNEAMPKKNKAVVANYVDMVND